MDETELERFRQQLLRLKTELLALEESSAAAGRPVELDQTRVGRLSRMDAIQGQQMAQETARRRQHRLRAIASIRLNSVIARSAARKSTDAGSISTRPMPAASNAPNNAPGPSRGDLSAALNYPARPA